MTDRMIPQAVTDELAFDPSIEAADIGVAVDEGIVTLSGHVGRDVARTAAETAAKMLHGVRGVVEKIEVRWAGDTVALHGKVRAWHERGIAERAAWSARGVRTVEDRIEIA